MRDSCLDIGIIQAFLDGELAQSESARVSGHIAACDSCAMMLADAEDESAIVFPALEREFNSLVPTQRLWNKINDSIAVEKRRMPIWQKAWSFFALNLTSPSFAGAASVLIVLGVLAAAWIGRGPSPFYNSQTASANLNTVTKPVLAAPTVSVPYTTGNDSVYAPSSQGVSAERANYRSNQQPANVRTASDIRQPSSPLTSTGYLPGEESYVKTISSLSRSVEDTKDSVMRPGERIAYERDMAVVDDAIAKMRTEVRKNPRNESAKQVLYSSYQNKIDLLNSVSQKEELVASLK